MSFRPFILLSLLGSLTLSSLAQVATIDDFTIRGNAYRTEDECFRLTEEVDYSSGSIWYKKPMSLKNPFLIELNIMAGCQDEVGADGMVFVFTPFKNQLGYMGEGIGFAGMVPSIGIELDTWRNFHLNDPAEDHIAIMANGRVGHVNDLAGPIKIKNIEDCTRHSLIVSWDPSSQILAVSIDYKEVIAAKADLLNGVFGGREAIYWGVTAATGRYNNIHEVCFHRTAMLDIEPDAGIWKYLSAR